jgi:hypothetical protein
MEDSMKKNLLLFCILALILGFLHGCSGKAGLPQGATKTTEYRGSFDSHKTYGIVQISLYDLPDGSTICKGFFRTTPGLSYWNLTGKVQGNQVQGGFQSGLTGQLTGTLSADGATMSGKFEIASPTTDYGTWQAKK